MYNCTSKLGRSVRQSNDGAAVHPPASWFATSLPHLRAPVCLFRDGSGYQNRWIFRKLPKGEGGSFSIHIPLSPSKFASYFGNFFSKIFNFFPKFLTFFQNFQFFSKVFNFFPKFSKKNSKFSEIFKFYKISKITIDFEYFPNIFRSIINNHTSWKFGWKWRSCYDHCLIEMPLNTRIQLN